MAIISVIVPVYNIEQYISKCLESIINQSFKDIEIIVVDDGSTDQSGAICDMYAQKDERICVIHKQNEGLVRARKTGLENSTSEYITYVDGDDWIEKDAYLHMYNDALLTDAEMLLYNHFESVGSKDILICHGIRSGFYDRKKIEKDIIPQMIAGEDFFEWRIFTSVWDALFKRELIYDIQMQVDNRLTIGEDVACVLPAILSTSSMFISEKSFYHYRQSTTSMVKRINDVVEERQKYSLLNGFMTDILRKSRWSKDLLQQWIDFMLFIMIPRAESVYEGFADLEYIFPFRNIKKGSKIALYCAGTYGQRLYQYIQSSGVAEVVIWADRNYEELSRLGLPICNPDKLKNSEFDAVVIATMFAGSRKSILKYVQSIVPEANVGMIDEMYLRSNEVLKGLRLV